jgi:hypothetical protein
MARYHFHVRDGSDFPDPDGTELTSIHAARVQALTSAGEMLRDAGKGGVFGKEWTMKVTDQDGLVLFTLDFQLTESRAVAGMARTDKFNE